MEPEPIDLDLVAASLRADLDDIAAFVEGLAVKLEETLPAATLVERGRRGFRGPKLVEKIAVEAGGDRLELRRKLGDARARVETLRARVSGGIVIKTEPLPIEEWLAALTAAIAAEAQRSERTRLALEKLLLGDG